MAYQRKQVYEVAEEFNCSEDDLISYLKRLGFYYIGRDSSVREDAYFSAKNYFSKPKPSAQTGSTVKSKPAQKIDKPSPAEVPEQKISVTVDYRTLLKKYDAEELKLSPTKYFEATRSVVDELLDILQQHE